jgi:hypothetical protein
MPGVAFVVFSTGILSRGGQAMKRFCVTCMLGLLLLGFTAQVKAQAPIPGQSYQIPAGFEGSAPGTVINYGGYSYLIQPGGTMQPLNQPSMPNYPYYNPVVGGSSYITPGSFNPYTGTTNYNTGTTTIYGSAYQGMTTPMAPGSGRVVYQPNPYGGYQTGYVWRDIYGIPHGDVSNVTPNPFGGVETTRKVYSIVRPR